MEQPIVGHIHKMQTLIPIIDRCQTDYHNLKVGHDHFSASLSGNGEQITSQYNGVKHLFILSGQGEIFLDISYRTQEGDGQPLPPFYEPDICDSENQPILKTLSENLDTMHDKIRPAIDSLLTRLSGNVLVGDISYPVRQMMEIGLPLREWSTRPKVRRALEVLQVNYSQLGWSTKKVAGFEPFGVGDQLTVTDDEPIIVRGEFDYFWVENTQIFMTHTTATRRLSYLRNSIASSASNQFRRLPLTWYPHTENEEEPDGVNSINNHVVYLTPQSNFAHYHPSSPIGGGSAEAQIYLIMDATQTPATEGWVKPQSRSGNLRIYPKLDDPSYYQDMSLDPGSVIYIPPDLGHYGLDLLANIISFPGFKPHNMIPIHSS